MVEEEVAEEDVFEFLDMREGSEARAWGGSGSGSDGWGGGGEHGGYTIKVRVSGKSRKAATADVEEGRQWWWRRRRRRYERDGKAPRGGQNVLWKMWRRKRQRGRGWVMSLA